jgi:hypothetical protein
MTDSELFENGEGVTPDGKHSPFNALGVAMILELHVLFPKAGEDSLRALMRTFFNMTFTNGEGLSGEIGRVIGKGTPIAPQTLAEAQNYREIVREHLKTVFREKLAALPQKGGSHE